jgi:hypothetical protein
MNETTKFTSHMCHELWHFAAALQKFQHSWELWSSVDWETYCKAVYEKQWIHENVAQAQKCVNSSSWSSQGIWKVSFQFISPLARRWSIHEQNCAANAMAGVQGNSFPLYMQKALSKDIKMQIWYCSYGLSRVWCSGKIIQPHMIKKFSTVTRERFFKELHLLCDWRLEMIRF